MADCSLHYVFDQPETLEDHIEDFLFYCDGKGTISAEQKKGLFMGTLDKPTKRSLRDWLGPALTPRTATFDQTLAKLREKIKPSVNAFVAWTNFVRRRQQDGETGAAFHADLKRLSSSCGFEGLESKLVLYQFVRGLHNKDLQRSLLARHTTLTLTEALQAVASSEESVESSRLVRGGVDVEEIHRADLGPSSATRTSGVLICFRCGEESHTARKCPKQWRNFKCSKCGKPHHLAKACRKNVNSSGDPSPAEDRPSSRRTHHVSEPDLSEDSDGLSVVRQALHAPASDEVVLRPVVGNVLINGKTLRFEIDSGASRTIISHPTFLSLYGDHPPPLYDSGVELITWGDAATLRTKGKFFTEVEFKGVKKYLPIMVGEGPGPSLMGRNWFIPFGLRVEGAYCVTDAPMANPANNSASTPLHLLPAVTGKGTGCYRGPPLHLDLDPAVPPVCRRARRVAFALTTKMEEAINANVEKGFWAPMQFAGSWASPIVPVMKSNGKLRLCADYSGTVNPALSPDSYRTSTPEEIFAALAGGKRFAEIDLEESYQQCAVDYETSRVLAVNTVKGFFRVLRMPYGISVAPPIFQRAIDGLIGGLPGTIAYQDNIYVSAQDSTELRTRVHRLLQILGDAGLKVNASKCTWEASCIQVLGFRIDASGRRPLPERVEAIKNAAAPKCKKELQSLLGFIGYYNCFFKNKATILEPLHRLLDHGAQWRWTEAHANALQAVKDLITSDDVLAHYSRNADLILTCDASSVGVGAVLATVVQDGNRRREAPICFASRTLSDTERRYSQLDREALAIKFGIKKFSQYVTARPFTIVTDHRPLLGIFAPGKPIPEHLSPRLMRWALELASMKYKLIYKSGKAIGHADYLSRNPIDKKPSLQKPEPAGVYLLEARDIRGLSPQEIARATEEDAVLKRVVEWTRHGWPTSVPDDCLDYFRKKTELSTLQDCLLFRDRVVIPLALRSKVLRLIHGTHQGESYSKTTARSIVWWPGMDKDVTNTVKQCSPCQENARAPPKKISPWPRAESAWERVHLDYFGPFHGHYFLLAVDSYSSWPVVRVVSGLSAAVLITHVRYIFADYGRPLLIVTDNGTSFASESFNCFLEKNGVGHLYSPPWHPASNGLAERNVATFKTIFKKQRAGDVHAKVARTLWAMRTAPSSIGRCTPAERMGRPFRTLLTQIHPATHPVKTLTASVPAHRPGDPVWARRHFVNGSEWLPGVVTGVHGARCYDVNLNSNQPMTNVSGDHLRRRVISDPQTTSTPSVNVSPTSEPETTSPPVEDRSNAAGDVHVEDASPTRQPETTSSPVEDRADGPSNDEPSSASLPVLREAAPPTAQETSSAQVSSSNNCTLPFSETNLTRNVPGDPSTDVTSGDTSAGDAVAAHVSGLSRSPVVASVPTAETPPSTEPVEDANTDTPFFGFSDTELAGRRTPLRPPPRATSCSPPGEAPASSSSGSPSAISPVGAPQNETAKSKRPNRGRAGSTGRRTNSPGTSWGSNTPNRRPGSGAGRGRGAPQARGDLVTRAGRESRQPERFSPS